MRPSNEELQQLDRDLDDLHREMIVMRREEFERDFLQRYHSNSLMCQQEEVKSPTSDPFGDIWGRTRSFYIGAPHEFVNTNWGIPATLAVLDIKNISKLLRDTGGWGTKIRQVTHQGRQYIILTGYPGLRRKLKGTRYGLRNLKLIEVGIGKYGIRGSSIKGLKISCYFGVGVEIAEWAFNHETVMSDLFAGVAIELIKAGIASAVGYALVMSLSAGMIAAASPIIAGAVFVFVVSVGLNYLDNHYGIKPAIKAGLRYVVENIETLQETITRIEIDHITQFAEQTALDAADHVVEQLFREAKSWILHRLRSDGIGLPAWPNAPRLPKSPSLPKINLPGLN